MKNSVLVLLFVLCFAETAISEFLVKPTSATVSKTSNGAAAYAIDGSGITNSPALATGDAVPDTWPSIDLDYSWSSRTWRAWGAGETITLTLHPTDTYSVSQIHLWNTLETVGGWGGTETLNIEVSTDNVNWTDVNGGSVYTMDPYVLPGQTFAFDQVYDNIQYVRITGVTVAGYTGFDEIRLIRPPDPPGSVFRFF